MEFDKSKVYTALNAGEVKVGSKGYFADNMSKLRERVADRQELHKIDKIADETYFCRLCWEDEKKQPHSNALFYLVEEPKELKYRPYDSIQEFLNVECDGDIDMVPEWIKLKNCFTYVKIDAFDFDNEEIRFGGYWKTLEKAFEEYIFTDGRPFGVKEC